MESPDGFWLRRQLTPRRVALAGAIVGLLVAGAVVGGKLHTCRIEVQGHR